MAASCVHTERNAFKYFFTSSKYFFLKFTNIFYLAAEQLERRERLSQKAESVSGLWFLESAPCWGAPRPLGPATCALPATTWPDTVLLPVPVYTVVLRSLRDKYF